MHGVGICCDACTGWNNALVFGVDGLGHQGIALN